MKDLVLTAKAVQKILEDSKLEYCIIGGIAVNRWGEERLTKDIDLSVLTGFGGESKVIDILLEHFLPRRPDAKDFALNSRVLLLRTMQGIEIDISLGAFDFEYSAVSRATFYDFGQGIELKTISAEDLIVMKTFAGREKDWGDIRGVIARNLDALDWKYIETQLKPLLELKEEPESWDQLLKVKTQIEKLLA